MSDQTPPGENPPIDPPNNPPSDPYGQAPGGTPADPYAQPPANPYGEPAAPPPAYGQPPAYDPGNPYGAQPPQGYGYGAAPTVAYASWGKRVLGTLVDWLLTLPSNIISQVGSNMSRQAALTNDVSGVGVMLSLIGGVISLAIFVWNQCFKQGRTGYTVGKGVIGIKLISEATGQPIGPGMSFVRQLAHILDALPCMLGFLWPLWDPKRQTFADKILGTIVIVEPKQ
jgi:uncharacterized RDD family membrane protein YckC